MRKAAAWPIDGNNDKNERKKRPKSQRDDRRKNIRKTITENKNLVKPNDHIKVTTRRRRKNNT